MTDFTYKEYEKFIEDVNLKLKESYNFKKLANILFNEDSLDFGLKFVYPNETEETYEDVSSYSYCGQF